MNNNEIVCKGNRPSAIPERLRDENTIFRLLHKKHYQLLPLAMAIFLPRYQKRLKLKTEKNRNYRLSKKQRILGSQIF